MTVLFLKLLNISITAGYIVIAVLIFRLILKKAPKRLRVILWGIAALRLVLPFSVESSFSLIPSRETVQVTDEVTITSGFEALDQAVNPVIREALRPEKESADTPQPITPETVSESREKSADRLSGTVRVAAYVWAAGVLLMLIYAAVSTLKIRYSVREAVRCGKRIYACDTVKTPFILGIIRPRIYLPYNLSAKDEKLVLEHEETHIRRGDHIWKPLGFLLLSVYWFNPLLWVGYIFLCRDIELACDEKVIGDLSHDAVADYSETLLRFSAPGRNVTACPVAFGETGVKSRIHSVLNYKKPALWLIAAAVIACIVLSVCFLTDPKQKEDHAYQEIPAAAVSLSFGESSTELIEKLGAPAEDLSTDPHTFMYRYENTDTAFGPADDVIFSGTDDRFGDTDGKEYSAGITRVQFNLSGCSVEDAEAALREYYSPLCVKTEIENSIGKLFSQGAGLSYAGWRYVFNDETVGRLSEEERARLDTLRKEAHAASLYDNGKEPEPLRDDEPLFEARIEDYVSGRLIVTLSGPFYGWLK